MNNKQLEKYILTSSDFDYFKKFIDIIKNSNIHDNYNNLILELDTELFKKFLNERWCTSEIHMYYMNNNIIYEFHKKYLKIVCIIIDYLYEILKIHNDIISQEKKIFYIGKYVELIKQDIPKIEYYFEYLHDNVNTTNNHPEIIFEVVKNTSPYIILTIIILLLSVVLYMIIYNKVELVIDDYVDKKYIDVVQNDTIVIPYNRKKKSSMNYRYPYFEDSNM